MNSNLPAVKELSRKNLEEVSSSRGFFERSDLAQEVVNHRAGFLEKWALLLFSILLLCLLLGSWFIKYPDVIKAEAILTGNNAPKEILARQSGRLIAFFVHNNQHVKQGQIIGWIESNADYREVVHLATRLDSSLKFIERGTPQNVIRLFDTRYANLGELQTGYQTFIFACQKYNDYLVNGFYANRKNMLIRDISSLQSMADQTIKQKKLIEKDNTLANSSFEMNKKLYEEKVISLEEYREAQSALLNKQLSLPQIGVSIFAIQNQIRDKQKEIDQLDHDIQQQQQTFEQALQTLKSNVDEWVRNYAIQAPADGIVVFSLPLQTNYQIDQGKLLGYVNPPDSKFYIELRINQNNFGKVDTGMKVQIRFDAYPYNETGSVIGTLQYISTVAIDSEFLGIVSLNNGLITNQNKKIQYKPGLKGEALIITKNLRLLERVYYSIVKVASVK